MTASTDPLWMQDLFLTGFPAVVDGFAPNEVVYVTFEDAYVATTAADANGILTYTMKVATATLVDGVYKIGYVGAQTGEQSIQLPLVLNDPRMQRIPASASTTASSIEVSDYRDYGMVISSGGFRPGEQVAVQSFLVGIWSLDPNVDAIVTANANGVVTYTYKQAAGQVVSAPRHLQLTGTRAGAVQAYQLIDFDVVADSIVAEPAAVAAPAAPELAATGVDATTGALAGLLLLLTGGLFVGVRRRLAL